MISFESIVRLSWGYARVLARKLRPHRDQLGRFLSNYEADGIVLFDANDVAVLHAASRCTACGQCDLAAWRDGNPDILGRDGPQAFVLGVSRHSGEHDAAAELPAGSDPRVAALTASCPVGVPFSDLVDVVGKRGAALARVRSRVPVRA